MPLANPDESDIVWNPISRHKELLKSSPKANLPISGPTVANWMEENENSATPKLKNSNRWWGLSFDRDSPVSSTSTSLNAVHSAKTGDTCFFSIDKAHRHNSIRWKPRKQRLSGTLEIAESSERLAYVMVSCRTFSPRMCLRKAKGNWGGRCTGKGRAYLQPPMTAILIMITPVGPIWCL